MLERHLIPCPICHGSTKVVQGVLACIANCRTQFYGLSSEKWYVSTDAELEAALAEIERLKGELGLFKDGACLYDMAKKVIKLDGTIHRMGEEHQKYKVHAAEVADKLRDSLREAAIEIASLRTLNKKFDHIDSAPVTIRVNNDYVYASTPTQE